MRIPRLHTWVRTYRSAVAVQERLRGRVRLEAMSGPVRTVAGVDVSYEKHGKRFFAGVVVMSLPALEVIETAWVARQAAFPYIPGLLTFREGPSVLAAFRKVKTAPDAVIFDGQGLAHPRRLGLASHLGLWLDRPSVGCAKSRLIGEHGRVPDRVGAQAPLTIDGEPVGTVLRTRKGVKPVYVSPGTRIDIAGAVDLVLHCGGGYRLPEPTRQAHLLVNRARLACRVPSPFKGEG